MCGFTLSMSDAYRPKLALFQTYRDSFISINYNSHLGDTLIALNIKT